MVIVTHPGTGKPEVDAIRERVEALGTRTFVSRWEGRTVIACLGEEAALRPLVGLDLPGVESVSPLPTPYRLASRRLNPAGTVVNVGEHATAGGRELLVIAGPCAVEGKTMLRRTALAVRAAGARALRGGVFKPRTSPYSFRGLREDGLAVLAEVRAETGLPVVTEVMDPRLVERVAEHADVLQIGARNMQNFPLLSEVGRVRRPVLLKRGPSATVEELLLAAEYVLSEGNGEVILCERGIRTFARATRNTLDVSAIPVLKAETHLPVIADPSHAAGRRELVPSLAFAAVAAGADGLLVEVHPRPEEALSDREQALSPADFEALMRGLSAFAGAAGRALPAPEREEPERRAMAVA